MKNNSRGNTSLEVLRIVFLFLLISTHWFYFWNPEIYIDTKIIEKISMISVSGFAIITGCFVHEKKSLLFRNFSRLIYIILWSIVLSVIVFKLTNRSLGGYEVGSWLSGSRDSWYLYVIIVIYAIAPFVSKILHRVKLIWVIIFTTLLLGGVLIDHQFGGFSTHMIWIYFLPFIPSLFYYLLLFGLTLLGFIINNIMKNYSKKKILFCAIIMFLFSVILISYIQILRFYKNTAADKYDSMFHGHRNPLIWMFAASSVIIALSINWQNKHINTFVKYTYFVYEFHWLWQICWAYYFKDYIKENPHLQLYVNWIVISLFGTMISIIISLVQFKLWQVYVDPIILKILKLFSWKNRNKNFD